MSIIASSGEGRSAVLDYRQQLERIDRLEATEAALRRELRTALALAEEARRDALRMAETLSLSEGKHRRMRSAWALRGEELRRLKEGLA